MMKEMTIEYDALKDLLHKNTGNPIAEEEIPQMVKDIIKAGGKVECTLEDLTIPVVIDEDGNIRFGSATY